MFILSNQFDWYPYAFGVIAIVIFILMGYLIVRGSKKNKKTPVSGEEFIEAFGGQDNVISVKATYSRLSVKLHDVKRANAARLRELGATAIIYNSGGMVLLFGQMAGEIAVAMERLLK